MLAQKYSVWTVCHIEIYIKLSYNNQLVYFFFLFLFTINILYDVIFWSTCLGMCWSSCAKANTYCLFINAVRLNILPFISRRISVSVFKLVPRASPGVMVSPPSQRLWVATLTLTLAVVEIPGVVPKCIFDEVQARSRVVRAASMQQADPLMVSEAITQTDQGENSRARRAALQPGKLLVETTPAQPIRIHSYKTEESRNLLQPERERLQAAVQEACSLVSSLLSGGPNMHKHSIQRARQLLMIKFQQSTERRLRCCSAETSTSTASSCGGIQAL